VSIIKFQHSIYYMSVMVPPLHSGVLDRSPPRTVKPSPGLPLAQRPDQGRPTRYWAVAPVASTYINGHTNRGSSVSPNSTLSPVPISGGARQRWEAPLLPPPELTATAGSGALESSSSSSKTQGMN
jgi:hypothetical protein